MITQEHPDFDAPYSGRNSLLPSEKAQTSITATLFGGRRLWPGSAAYFNPELGGGSGFSQTTGVAGYPNAEIYRVDDPRPKWSVARAYLKQTFGFGGDQERIEADQNLLAESVDVRRLTFVAGKFALNDFFDGNTYAHDPRTQFMNWALMDSGAWDYAADTRGYTWGLYIELNQPDWSVRYAAAYEPEEANGLKLDTQYPTVRGDNLEFEYRYAISGRRGAARLLGFDNHARMATYRDAIVSTAPGDSPAFLGSQPIRGKYGFALNLEHELTSDLGAFIKGSWNNGVTQTWAFAEIDRSLALGASLKGARWFRPNDTTALALIVNGISQDHREYLALGGYGFMIGDGRLSYGPEEILEYYYSLKVSKEFALTADYQFVNHPAYNQDRGPVSIFSARVHYAF